MKRALPLVAMLTSAASAQVREVPRLTNPALPAPAIWVATPATLDAARPSALPAQTVALPVIAAPPIAEQAKPVYHIPPTVTERLSVDKGNPTISKYIDMMEKLAAAWQSPYSVSQVSQAQADAAEAAGVDVTMPKRPNGVIVIPPGRRGRMNRWADMFARTMHGTVLWSPISNHDKGDGAAWNANNGWLWADNFSPLMSRPSKELQHEFLHAYVDRGKHAKKFTPLTTCFNKTDWREFPAAEKHPDAFYRHDIQFRADELLTNLHTLFYSAKEALEVHADGRRGWTGSSLAQAPQEVQLVVKWIDTPLFLAESLTTMTNQLLPVAYRVAREGTGGNGFKKSYGRENGSIPTMGENERNKAEDRGFYDAKLDTPEQGTATMRFYSKGQFQNKEGEPIEGSNFPVTIGRDGYAARVNLNREFMLEGDLDGPELQELAARTAAGILAPRLAATARAIKHIEPQLAKIKALQDESKENVDLALVMDIRIAARAAFLALAHFFIRGA
jgi:hypothetical protein